MEGLGKNGPEGEYNMDETFDYYGDLIITVDDGNAGATRRYLVDSRTLARHSARYLSLDMAKVTSETIRIVLNIVHGYFKRVPPRVSEDTLFHILDFTNRYGMTQILRPYTKRWVGRLPEWLKYGEEVVDDWIFHPALPLAKLRETFPRLATAVYRKLRHGQALTNLRVCRVLGAFYTCKAGTILIDSAYPELQSHHPIFAHLWMLPLQLANYLINLFGILLLLREVATRAKRCINQEHQSHWTQERVSSIALAVVVTLMAMTSGGPNTGILTPPMWVVCYFMAGEPNAGAELWDGGLKRALEAISIGRICLLALLHSIICATGNSLEALTSLVTTTKDLITQLETFLHAVSVDKTATTTPPSPSSPAAVDPATNVDALSLAHDSASLIRAHTTKLSLLIINEPFTPSAIVTVLRELVAGPIPGIASAVQVCSAEKYTKVARQDLAWRCYRVLHELKALVEVIPLDGKILRNRQKNGGKGSLAATGVVWSACDDVILLKKLGIAGMLVKKVEEYRDTLKDVLEELKEWSEEIDEEDDDSEGGGDGDANGSSNDVNEVADQLQNSHISTQDMIDDLMNPQHIPRDDPDKIRERLDSCLKRLRLTTLLYSAVAKRRLKTLPSLPTTAADSTVAQRLDEVIPILKRLPHRFGDVAYAFYNMDRVSIDREMDACFFDAFAASEMLMKPWEGQRDEFTDWAEKFQVSIKKPD
ncbi:hypothetical protein SLS62_005765 [Diatrype stigma]|uniref:Cyclin-D1-binding protein 1-like N-terminal domain-containing protein n=1 Tax=Diatrype stigma TaxID=117547 RepID=A0AAN9UQK6_9PEZI